MKKYFSKTLLFLFITVSTVFPFSSALAYDRLGAENYLKAHANNPWVTMGLVAINAENIPLDYLKTVSGSSAIDYAAPILAITASGNDPRTFGAQDLIGKLKSYHEQNQIGDIAVINDDIFGMLALIASGEPLSDPAIVDAKNFIFAHQKPSGGWGFAVSGGEDSNTTAAAIVALKAAGAAPSDDRIIKAVDYLKAAQRDDGGFAYDLQSQSDSSSTAWVLWALNSLGIKHEATWSRAGHTPDEYLTSTQNQAGYFEWQAGAGENVFSPVNTAYAVIALENQNLPLKIVQPAQSQFAFRIEGARGTVCEGRAAGPTALDIVKNASVLCGFTYHIKDTSFGPYLDKIGDDEASGAAGWLYWINFNPPAIGAADYRLKDGDEVLWAFGNFDLKPARLLLSPTEIGTGLSAQALAEYRDNGEWKALENARIAAPAASAFTSDSSGKAQISGPDGYYKVFAEKDGYVRSGKLLLKIGNPASSNVNLLIDVRSGVAGTSTPPSGLAFTVEPSSLDFGAVNAGQSAAKTLKIINTGALNLQFKSEVATGQLFKDNLKLDGKIWQQFKANVPANQYQNVAAGLAVPQGYQNGRQTGTLIFWATAE